MRDIDFKAKIIKSDDGTDGQWETGYYWYTNNSLNIPLGGPPIVHKHYLHIWIPGDWGLGGWKDVEINPNTLCQFTGRYTKKDEWKIYEGDLLMKPGGFDGIYEIYWSQKDLGFKYRLVNGEPDWNPSEEKECEVELYGNKFDSPSWYPLIEPSYKRTKISSYYPEEWIIFLGNEKDTDIYYLLDADKKCWMMQVKSYSHRITLGSTLTDDHLDPLHIDTEIYEKWLIEINKRKLIN